jgi:phytoene dehydrogenase-like protein
VFVLVPFPADPALGAADDRAALEAHADRYLDQAGAWAGIPDLRERVVTRRVVGPADFARDLSAWRGTALGMEHTLRQSAVFRPGHVSPRVPNLIYVGGGTIPGVGLPMCLISAELVAKRLLGDTSTRRLPEPLRPGYLHAARRPGLWTASGPSSATGSHAAAGAQTAGLLASRPPAAR